MCGCVYLWSIIGVALYSDGVVELWSCVYVELLIC